MSISLAMLYASCSMTKPIAVGQRHFRCCGASCLWGGKLQMKITTRLGVPTGDILIVDGEHGKLEVVSLGDYGKNHNLKADFLGLDRELGEVNHTNLLPLSEKWVI